VIVTALLTGRNAMKIMWNREKLAGVGRSALDVIDGLLSLATTRRSGEGQPVLPSFVQMAKCSDKIIWCFWPNKNRYYTFRKTWKLLITDENFHTILRHTNQYTSILIFQPNLSRENDAKLTVKIEIKAVIGPMTLAGALHSNNQILRELWVSGRDGTEKCLVVMNQ
jgi:hypothetical protein